MTECRHCGEMIADPESAPRDSTGAYCNDCDIQDAFDIALQDSVGDDEGNLRATTVLRHLAKQGLRITRIEPLEAAER